MNSPPAITCEIRARRAVESTALASIAQTCARDTGQPLVVAIAPPDLSLREPVVTLRLPAELAASQHQVWCLACRLACFCPDARVSVLVLGASAFASDPMKNIRCA